MVQTSTAVRYNDKPVEINLMLTGVTYKEAMKRFAYFCSLLVLRGGVGSRPRSETQPKTILRRDDMEEERHYAEHWHPVTSINTALSSKALHQHSLFVLLSYVTETSTVCSGQKMLPLGQTIKTSEDQQRFPNRKQENNSCHVDP